MIPTNYQHFKSTRKLRLAAVLGFAALLFISVVTRRSGAVVIQEKEAKNPLTGNTKAVGEGRGLFLLSCAYCHGIDARGGGRGPDLASGDWTHGETDADLLRTVTKGIPGTDMPSCNCEEEEAWKLIAYVRSLSTDTRTAVAGDRVAGEKIFFGQGACNACHVVGGKGGRFGPDLSRVGAARPTHHLIESIRDPGKDIPAGYETVTAVLQDGKRITGVRKNEDTFSLQLMDQAEQYHLLLKKELKEVIHDPQSLMPAYGEQTINQKDMQNLIAYLESLRGKKQLQGKPPQEKKPL